MLTRVLIARHGDSFHRREGIMGGARGCRGLTPEGRDDAAALATRLQGERSPTAIVSSPLPRAFQTAEIISERLGLPEPETDPRLSSWLVPPEVDGLPVVEYKRRYSIPGGGVFRPYESVMETWAELVTRSSQALWEIAARRQDAVTLVVAHAETVNASLVAFGSLPLYRPFGTEVANASITEWKTDGDPNSDPPARWTLVRWNDARSKVEPTGHSPSREENGVPI